MVRDRNRGRLKNPETNRRQSGLTLIEIMVTVVLMSILILGISGLWANVSGDFVALTIRQKAIFVLGGEMERLSALYRFGDFPAVEASSGYDTAGGLLPANRNVYPDAAANPSSVVDDIVVTSTDATFNCGDESCAGQVLFIPNAVSATSRNYVWIDQARNIVGELSLAIAPVASPGTVDPANCVNGGTNPCQELTVYLEFPLRYQNDTTVPPFAELGRQETLSLKTIVGERP